MRWVTAQELSKIARRAPDSDKPLPERTIRHMALQKRINTKKEGKTWLIDPASALRAGLYIPPEHIASLQLKKDDSLTETSGTPPKDSEAQKSKAGSTEGKRYKKLGELGVYNELKGLYLKELVQKEGPLKEAIKQTLYHIALGFYEYTQVDKAEYFKRARKHLVSAIVEDDLAQSDQSEWRDQLEDSIMPGIIGLIRKQEGGKRGRGQLKDKGKD